MVRAAVTGVIDFAKVDIRERLSKQRIRIILSALETNDTAAFLRIAFDYERSLVANSGLTDDSFKEAQKRAREYFDAIKKIAIPWNKVTAESIQMSRAAEMRAAYAKYVEDPDTPEFKQKVLHDLALQEAMPVVTASVETEEQRINRLTQARDEYMAKLREANGKVTKKV